MRGCASRGSFENKNNYKETGGASWVRSKKHPGKGVCIFKFENTDNYSEPGWDISGWPKRDRGPRRGCASRESFGNKDDYREPGSGILG